jgi:hypothetical protein
MTRKPKLELEVLGGPLDGYVISLETKTEWTRQPGSLLSFPWDMSLGEPQAFFMNVEQGWVLEHANAKRGTHIIRSDYEDQLPTILRDGDILKASNTWLKVRSVSE